MEYMTQETVALIEREIGPYAAALAKKLLWRQERLMHLYGMENAFLFGRRVF